MVRSNPRVPGGGGGMILFPVSKVRLSVCPSDRDTLGAKCARNAVKIGMIVQL